MGFISDLFAKLSRPSKARATTASIYDFTITDISGNEIHMDTYRGKNLLIVNTASKCGYTPQYADLENLHQTYGNTITVVGFPANNFLWQEPGSDQEIASFCQKNYGVTFKMFSKISVKGKDQHPLYQWLQAKTGKVPTWNFCKYLVDKDGNEVKFFGSKVNPLDIIKDLKTNVN
jgi:glutathione peroxidase